MGVVGVDPKSSDDGDGTADADGDDDDDGCFCNLALTSGVVTLLEFESKEAVEKFYFSDDYQAAKAIRDQGCDTDLMIIEGM